MLHNAVLNSKYTFATHNTPVSITCTEMIEILFYICLVSYFMPNLTAFKSVNCLKDNRIFYKLRDSLLKPVA